MLELVQIGRLKIEAVAKVFSRLKDDLQKGAVGLARHPGFDQVKLIGRHQLEDLDPDSPAGVAPQGFDDLDVLRRLRSVALTEFQRRPLANSCIAHAAAACRKCSAIQRSISASARALRACRFAIAFSLPRRRVPSGFLVGGLASGGNQPKLTFIGWNERGPLSMVSR